MKIWTAQIRSIAVSLLVAAGVCLPSLTTALPGDRAAFVARYPSTAGTKLDSCTTCHTQVPGLNPYGADYAEADRQFGTIEPLDSDGDGAINLDEILALTFPGDPADQPVVTPTPPVEATPTPTQTLLPGVCPADCNDDGSVTVDELITAINIALGTASVEECLAADLDANGEIVIGELISAVNAALEGC